MAGLLPKSTTDRACFADETPHGLGGRHGAHGRGRRPQTHQKLAHPRRRGRQPQETEHVQGHTRTGSVDGVSGRETDGEGGGAAGVTLPARARRRPRDGTTRQKRNGSQRSQERLRVSGRMGVGGREDRSLQAGRREEEKAEDVAEPPPAGRERTVQRTRAGSPRRAGRRGRCVRRKQGTRIDTQTRPSKNKTANAESGTSKATFRREGTITMRSGRQTRRTQSPAVLHGKKR